MVDAATKKTLSGIPLCKTKAGPRDKEIWMPRLKEEYQVELTSLFRFLYYFISAVLDKIREQ